MDLWHKKHYKMKVKILIILCILLVGCKHKNYYKDKIEKSFKIEISDNFKVVTSQKGMSMTSDYNETFGLQFTKKEFWEIFNLIRPKRAIADSNLFYYEIVNNNIFTELTFEPKTYIIYYNEIQE